MSTGTGQDADGGQQGAAIETFQVQGLHGRTMSSDQHPAARPHAQQDEDSENTEDDETRNGGAWQADGDGDYDNGGPPKKQKIAISAAARQQKVSNDHGGCRNHTGYIGVRKRNWGMYAAEIRDGAKRRWLGSFSQAKEAGQAYDAALILQKKHRAKTNFTYIDFATIPRPGAEPGGKVRYSLIPKDIMDLYKDQYKEVLDIISNGGGLGMPLGMMNGGGGGDDESGDVGDDDPDGGHQQHMRNNGRGMGGRMALPGRNGASRAYPSPAVKANAAVTAAAGALSDLAHQPYGGDGMMVANGRGARGAGGRDHMNQGMLVPYGQDGGMMMMHGGGGQRAGKGGGGRAKPQPLGYDLAGAADDGNQNGMESHVAVPGLYMQGMAMNMAGGYMAPQPYIPMQPGGEDADGQEGDEDEEGDDGAPGYSILGHPYAMNNGYPTMMGMAPPMGMMMPGMHHPGMHPMPGMAYAYGGGYAQPQYPTAQGSSEDDGEEEEEEDEGQAGPGGMHGHPMTYMMNPAAAMGGPGNMGGMVQWNGMPGPQMMAPGAMGPGGMVGWSGMPVRAGRDRSSGGKSQAGAQPGTQMMAPGIMVAGMASPQGRGNTRAAAGGRRNVSPGELAGRPQQMAGQQQKGDGENGHLPGSGDRRRAGNPAQVGDPVPEHVFDYPGQYDPAVGGADGAGPQGGGRMMQNGRMIQAGYPLAAGYGHEGHMDQAMYAGGYPQAYQATAYMVPHAMTKPGSWSQDMGEMRRTPNKGMAPGARHKMAAP